MNCHTPSLQSHCRSDVPHDLHISIKPVLQPLHHLDCSGSFFLGQRRESEVWLNYAELREQSLSLLVLDTWVDNDFITWDPIDGSGDAMLVAGLQRVDNTKDLSGVATSGGRV